MPIFEFRCQGCGFEFELLAFSQGDVVEARCPQCQCKDLVKLMSAGSVVMGGDSGSASGAQAPGVQSRTCENKGSCTTITLPGHTR